MEEQYAKKRELMSKLNDVIAACVNMGADVAKLEMSDNLEASKRLKRDIADIQQGPLKIFKEAIYGVRHEIITTPKPKKIDGRANNGKHFRRKKQYTEPDRNEDDF